MNYWEKLSRSIQTPSETYSKRVDISDGDASFILKYTSPTSNVLDIGAGSGMVVNKIRRHVDQVVAVETYPGFSQFIDNAENVLVINANIENFKIRKSFDVVTATGIMQFFPESAVRDIYQNIYDMLKPGGRLVMRAHVGLYETVRVEKSDELQADYFAEFRHVDLETKILQECGFAVEVIDEVAPEFSVWDNTKHLYFVGSKGEVSQTASEV